MSLVALYVSSHLRFPNATNCSTLQCTAAHCVTLQFTATDCKALQHTRTPRALETAIPSCMSRICFVWGAARRCNALQDTTRHCNTLQHTAAHCSTLQHTAAHCSTLQHTAAHCSTLQHTAAHCSTLQHTAAHCSTLQHTAAHCSTPHHNATHCNPKLQMCCLCCNVYCCTTQLYRNSRNYAQLHATRRCCALQQCCNSLSYVATVLSATTTPLSGLWLFDCSSHCNTLQHTATHCNTLQHTAAHRSTLQHTATHCDTRNTL